MDISEVLVRVECFPDLYPVCMADWDAKDLKIWEDRDGVDLYYRNHLVNAVYVRSHDDPCVFRAGSIWDVIQYLKKRELAKVLKHPPRKKKELP